MISATTSAGLEEQNDRKTILIVEDDPNLRTFYLDALSEYKVVTATSGEEAMRLFSGSNAFDLVILDYKLPGMSGLDLLKEIRKVIPSIPVIMVSVHGEDEIAAGSFQLGAIDFLEKPFNVSDLIRKVNAHLYGRSA
jgi:DNA-binding response OmpR family regulator